MQKQWVMFWPLIEYQWMKNFLLVKSSLELNRKLKEQRRTLERYIHKIWSFSHVFVCIYTAIHTILTWPIKLNQKLIEISEIALSGRDYQLKIMFEKCLNNTVVQCDNIIKILGIVKRGHVYATFFLIRWMILNMLKQHYQSKTKGRVFNYFKAYSHVNILKQQETKT